MDDRVVGVLGGGQLGRMMAEAGHRLGIKLAVLDPGGKSSPAGQVAAVAIEGSFRDADKIRELAGQVDVLTVEIEHVNCDVLAELEGQGVKVQPSSETIRVIQDKYLQKQHMTKNGVPGPDFVDAPTPADVIAAGEQFGYPLVLKAKKMAYDGKGNAVVDAEGGIQAAWDKLGGKELYVERWCPFTKELAVMVVRSESGETRTYPVVHTTQKDNICHTTLVPAGISKQSEKDALSFASKAVGSLWGAGIFGVELFLLPDGSILLNEIAPRPHNSGHYTYEACECDQFENHLRAVLGLPLGGTGLKVGASLMLNVLGQKDSLEDTKALCRKALPIPGAAVHWYGKAESRVGRKMAHITFCADSLEELRKRSEPYELLQEADTSSPKVGIIMGSDSDLPTMKAAADILDKFSIPYEVTIVSAHRTPQRLFEYSRDAAPRGLRVIIAGAGGAAHLPGMCAAMTPLPVVGVPVKTATLSGVDSLHSIVQMPRGVPVATVAIGNAMNAGLLAAKILSVADPALLRALEEFMQAQEKEVLDKATAMATIGWRAFLAKRENQNTTVGI